MKKKDIILIGIVILVIILTIFVVDRKSNSNKVVIEKPVTLTGESGVVTNATYPQYEELITAGDPFMVTIIQTGCSYCEKFEPVLEEVVSEYNLPAYYLNISNLTSEEVQSLNQSNSYLKRNQWGTPTTLILVGDKVIDSIGGYIEKDGLVTFLEDNVLMGEE